jgi:hypothetical protein
MVTTSKFATDIFVVVTRKTEMSDCDIKHLSEL